MLYNTVQQFRGTDATSWLTSTSSTALAVELAKLYLGYEKLIVASLRREITLPEISLSVLTEKNNAGIDGGAWVAVGSDVYDVTSKFSPFTLSPFSSHHPVAPPSATYCHVSYLLVT